MTMPVAETNPTVRAAANEQRHTKNLIILFAESVSAAATGGDSTYGETAEAGRYNDLAATVIRNPRGQVIKTSGASVMAEFANAADAVRAAVYMERVLTESAERLTQCDQPGLRIGIHGLMGQPDRIDLFGSVAQVAGNITSHAASGQILTSREICEALSQQSDLYFQWNRKVTIEGQAEGQEVFEVHWATAPAGIPSRYASAFQVGTGGMGVVFKARDRETGEIVALKVLRSDIAADPAMQENLRREVCLARKVTHKNVCRIHEFSRSNGIAYISMEFVEGASLLSTLQRSGAMSWDRALRIVRQVCSGLGEAHAQGIVHRDLKPANIMMDRNGVAKIMDFGIARSFQGTGQMTGTLVGTPAYMAPEQVELKGIDARTDVYALGLLLYEIVTGVQAFEGDPPIAVALKQLREFPTRPRQIVPSLPAHAENVILKCMQKDPAKRFQSMEEVAAALSRTNAPAKPAVSMWSEFVSDLRRSGRDLRRDLQPRFAAVGAFFQRQDWRFFTSKRTQKALAIGLGTACVLAGVGFLGVKAIRNRRAANAAAIESSEVDFSQLPLPQTAAPDELVRIAAAQSDPANAGALTGRVDQPSTKSDAGNNSEHDAAAHSKLRVARLSRAEKAKPTGNLAASSTASTDAAQPLDTQTRLSLPAAAASPSPAATGGTSAGAKPTDPSTHASASLLPAHAPATSAPVAADAKPADATPAVETSYLEVGSFKESTWADHAVEELTALGFHAVSVRKTMLWSKSYQVRVGPYTDAKTLDAARQDLVSQGFKPHVVK